MNTWFTLDIDGVKSRRSNGSAVTIALAMGTHTLTAYWEGDTSSPRCTSAPGTVNTQKADPSFLVSSTTGLTVRAGQPNVVNLGITGPAGFTGPSGSVQLERGVNVLTMSAVSNGAAVLSTTFGRGSYDVAAVYSGDANFNSASLDVTLSVLQNVPVAIDARSLESAISIRAVLPSDYQSAVLSRRVAGTTTWSAVPGWSPNSEFDTGVTRGVLYEYQLTAGTPDGSLLSNIDPAMLFTDDRSSASSFTDDAVAGTTIKAVHIQELRRQVF